MKYLDMEGGFYGIEADSGGRYRPVNLQGAFAEGGLRVRFCANPVEGVMSFQMWGIPVEIVDMESLETKGKSEPATGPQNTWKPRNP